MNLQEKAKELILKNSALTGNKYIAPDASFFHEDQWLWDSCFHAIVCAELGLKDLAKNEINRLLMWQKEEGWIPHQIYKSRKRKWFNLERLFYKKEHSRFHSSITHPPVIAQAVEAINDPEWTQKILPKLIKFYLYFLQKQDPDGNGLISVCHPCETGRDTSVEFDCFRAHFKKCAPFDQLLFYLFLYNLEFNYKKLNWQIDKIWERNLINVEDLMFNCIWADGLGSLERLISAYGSEDLCLGLSWKNIKELQEYIRKLKDETEKAVYKQCWDEENQVFYSLDSKNQKIKRLTISSLFPLILDNIPEKMHRALVKHLKNPEEFWTPYPIPSLARNDPEFDPSHGFYCNWRGPTWINMNWFIIKGLQKHGYYEIAAEITRKTQEMVKREGFREFYNPLTGQGLRQATKGFGWSTLVITFPKIIEKRE